MNHVLQSKLNRGFNFFDGDGGGWLTRSDFLAVTARLVGAFPQTAKAKIDRLDSAFSVLWDKYLKDREGGTDGSVGPGEFTLRIGEALAANREGFLRDLNNVANSWLDIADTDGDGVLSEEEFTKMYAHAFGLAPAATAKGFARLDRNGSGTLDIAQIRLAVNEYWTSEDPDAAGNWLYGPM